MVAHTKPTCSVPQVSILDPYSSPTCFPVPYHCTTSGFGKCKYASKKANYQRVSPLRVLHSLSYPQMYEAQQLEVLHATKGTDELSDVLLGGQHILCWILAAKCGRKPACEAWAIAHSATELSIEINGLMLHLVCKHGYPLCDKILLRHFLKQRSPPSCLVHF